MKRDKATSPKSLRGKRPKQSPRKQESASPPAKNGAARNDEKAPLPPGWVWTTLGEACETVMGQSPPSSTYNIEGVGLPFYQGKAEFGNLYPTPAKWCSKPGKIAELGDVLISVRAPVGPTNLCQEKSCIGRGLAAVRPESSMPSRYFLYALRYFEQKLAEKATGTTFAAISGKVLRDQKVPLAPLPEQHRIVAKIEELLTDLDAGIAALKQAQANLKRYKAAVLSAACQGRLAPQDPNDEPAAKLLERILAERRATTRRATARVAPTTPAPTVGASLADAPLPDGWCWASVEQLAQSIQYGYTESAQQEPIGPKFLRITDIQNGQVDWGAVPYCACSENDYQKYRLQTGDIVFARTGATTGKSYLISVCPDAVFASYLIRLRLAGCVVNGYFALFLDSPMYWSQIITVRKGSAQPGVNATILATLHVPLPPLAEQRRIVAEVERRLSVAQELEASISANLARAERLRQSILKRAFEGKLVPQDPNDEPASVLLEKIRANRVGATLAVAPDAVAHDAATLRAGASPAPTKDEKSL